MKNLMVVLMVALMFVGVGCKKDEVKNSQGKAVPAFVVSYNIYPSSCTLPVAVDLGLLSDDPAKMGTMEKKWDVKVNLKRGSYDNLLAMLGNKAADATIVTYNDVFAVATGRDVVCVFPVSESKNADGIVVTEDIKTVDDLKGVPTKGFEKSVSQYVFERNLELLGKKIADFPYSNMDGDEAAKAMVTGDVGVKSAACFNPALMNVIKNRKGAKLLFGSATMPKEIIDVMVVGKDVLAKDGGDRLACCLIDVWLEVNKRMADPAQRDKIVEGLGLKYSDLAKGDMKVLMEQTPFFGTADAGIGLFNDPNWQGVIVPRVMAFNLSHGVVDKSPTYGFDNDNVQVNFTTKYIKMVVAKK